MVPCSKRQQCFSNGMGIIVKCMYLVFIILYILLDDEASINANHSCILQFLVTSSNKPVFICETL